MLEFARLAASVDSQEFAGCLGNIRGFVETVSGAPHPIIVVLISLLVVACCATFKGAREECFALAVVAALLVSYHGHFYDEVLLAIPITVALQRSRWPAALVLISPAFLFWPHGIYVWALITVTLGVSLLRATTRAEQLPFQAA
jgi:hypothetical protein